jgi:hypothetical protein
MQSLYCEVLSHGPELFIYIAIVSFLVLPFGKDQLQCLLQDVLRSHVLRVRGSRQSEVRLL